MLTQTRYSFWRGEVSYEGEYVEVVNGSAINLPTPSPGKFGWPWTEEPPPVPVVLTDSKPWPRISVITPSYNQGEFLEQTIRSVLLQGYPNLEYIIIDGGSSDNSVEIIKKYEQYLTHWISEPDRGQSHAINKGFEKSSGQIMCWLNSDDYYLPGTLQFVAEHLADNSGAFALIGHCYVVYTDGRPPLIAKGRYENRQQLLRYWTGYQMHQPSIFWRREVYKKVGFLDESQHYIMDFDYWTRIAQHFDFMNVDRFLSCATYHPAAKTGDNYEQYLRALRKQAPLYWGSALKSEYWALKLSMHKHLVYYPLINKIKDTSYSYICRATKLFR